MAKTDNRMVGLTAGEAISAYRICWRDPADSGKAKHVISIAKPPLFVSLGSAVADDAYGDFEELREGDVIEVMFDAACADGRSVRVKASSAGVVEPVTAAFAGYILGECVGAVGGGSRRGFVRVCRRVSDATTNITAG